MGTQQQWLPLVLTALISVFASSGFWAFINKKNSKKDATNRLLLGLAYDKLISRGMSYINRGWLYKDEYEEFQKYLYEPYKQFGGNGVAERVMQGVQSLPLRSPGRYSEINKDNRTGRKF